MNDEMWELSDSIDPVMDNGARVSNMTLHKMISDYYRDNPAGGNAHLVFDERSISDETIRYCIQQSVLNGDWVCAGILMELMKRHPKFREAIVA